MADYVFSRQTVINADVGTVFEWHSRPGAIERLSPPWDPIRVVSRTGGIEKGARVVLRMKAGPLGYLWHAEHTEYEKNSRFVDEQVKGPMRFWRHVHSFEPAGKGGCLLKDTIVYRPPLAPLSGPVASGAIYRKLSRIFAYRQRVTASDIAQHLAYGDLPRMTILVSGASGLIGSNLVPFLTTGGHRVVRLVRRAPVSDDEVSWDPEEGRIDVERIEAAKPDAVIHLAGENIGTGRWTDAKKRKIVESRRLGTDLLAETAARLSSRPRVFISASAIGFYGDGGERVFTEDDGSGGDFLSSVCDAWEKSVFPASQSGIRTVQMRIGVVLTPLGGALARMLPLFRAGLGGRIGKGDQYISWVGMDDAIGAVHHALMNESIEGAVNIVSPNPVTNERFAKALAAVLERPAAIPVPKIAVSAAFGEMGRAVLLTSTRVAPQKLVHSGYRFLYPDLEDALLHLLGKRF